MNDEVWKALNAVQESFNEIHTIEFLVEKLEKAVEEGDLATIANASISLSSFLPMYTKNWEETFHDAWKVCGGNVNLCEWIESCD